MNTRRLSPKTRTRALVLGGALLLLLLILLGHAWGGKAALTGEKVTTAEERVQFLADCGWIADAASEQEQVIHIPETFPAVYEDYNALQLQQGYDLHDYAGKDCILFTYDITNWPDESQTVLANLYVYKGRIIGGDIHSTNLDGFMIGIK